MKRLTQRRPVRVSIPAKVAYDLDSFNKSLIDLLDELGCKSCCSGYDITFETFRGPYAIGHDLEVTRLRPQHQLRTADIEVGDRDYEPIQVVKVGLHEKAAFNIEVITEAVAKIAGELGHIACVSGFDIRFQNQLDFMVNAQGNVVQEFA